MLSGFFLNDNKLLRNSSDLYKDMKESLRSQKPRFDIILI